MAKQYIWTELDLPFDDKEKMLVWNELKAKNIKELKSGQYLFEFFKLGFSAIQIDSMVNLRPSTIEKRCIEFLKGKENNYEDFKFLFEKCIGLPRINDVNIFLRSGYLNLNDFCNNEGIDCDAFKEYLNNLSTVQYVKERLDNKNQQIQSKKEINRKLIFKKCKWNTSIRCAIRLA